MFHDLLPPLVIGRPVISRIHTDNIVMFPLPGQNHYEGLGFCFISEVSFENKTILVMVTHCENVISSKELF